MFFQVLEEKLENEMDLNNKAREPDEDFKVLNKNQHNLFFFISS